MYWNVPRIVPCAVIDCSCVASPASADPRHASGVQFREAEVEQLRAALRQHDIGRLQIAVHDPLPVGAVQRSGNLDRDAQRLIDGERPTAKTFRKRLALQVLHDEEVDVVLAADVVERADVRMLEAGDRARFALESVARVRIGGDVRPEHLERDGAIQPRVARLVDLAHAAGADGGDDLVRAETGPR
jgi:hypothetical protein